MYTDEEREECTQCAYSRFEAYDKGVKKYIASVAYDPSRCFIELLSVDEEFQKQGIGTALARKAIEDMRVNGCGEIALSSLWSAQGFWEKTGATSKRGSLHVFPDPSSNLS